MPEFKGIQDGWVWGAAQRVVSPPALEAFEVCENFCF